MAVESIFHFHASYFIIYFNHNLKIQVHESSLELGKTVKISTRALPALDALSVCSAAVTQGINCRVLHSIRNSIAQMGMSPLMEMGSIWTCLEE